MRSSSRPPALSRSTPAPASTRSSSPDGVAGAGGIPSPPADVEPEAATLATAPRLEPKPSPNQVREPKGEGSRATRQRRDRRKAWKQRKPRRAKRRQCRRIQVQQQQAPSCPAPPASSAVPSSAPSSSSFSPAGPAEDPPPRTPSPFATAVNTMAFADVCFRCHGVRPISAAQKAGPHRELHQVKGPSTALMVACSSGQFDMACYLVESAGADVLMKNKVRTPAVCVVCQVHVLT